MLATRKAKKLPDPFGEVSIYSNLSAQTIKTRFRNNFKQHNHNHEMASSDSSISSVSSHVSSFPRRNYRQGKKRPNEHQKEHHADGKRRIDTRDTGDFNMEVTGNTNTNTANPQSTNPKTPNTFLGQPHSATPHSGTILAHFQNKWTETKLLNA